MGAHGLDLTYIKSTFSKLVVDAQPWTLTQFVMWLDLKLSEYKIKGYMVLDHHTQTKPKWIAEDDDTDRNEMAPRPPSCPTCNPKHSGQPMGGKNRDRGGRLSQQQLRSRGQQDSYVNEVLNVSSEQTDGGHGSARHPNRSDLTSVISLESAENLSEQDMALFGDKASLHLSSMEGPSPRTKHQVRPPLSNVPPDRTAQGRSAGINSQARMPTLQHGPSASMGREPSPPKKHVAMVDLSHSEVPEPDSVVIKRPSSQTDLASRNNSKPSSSISSSISFVPPGKESSKGDDKPVPVALHVVKQPSPSEANAAAMDTSLPTPMGGIKQETIDVDLSVEDESQAFQGGEDSMYMMTDNSLSDSDSSFNQNLPQDASMSISQAFSSSYLPSSVFINEDEIDLPRFEDPIVRKVLEDGITPTRHMWSKIITKCAYHMLSKGVPHKHDYQLFSRAFYMKYPCVGTTRGPNPWTFMALGLSQKVRNTRRKAKKTRLAQS